MCPASVSANSPSREIEQLRAVMVLLSARGLAPAEIAALLECHPSTVRRWIGRFNAEGRPGWPTGRGAAGPGWAGAVCPGGSLRC